MKTLVKSKIVLEDNGKGMTIYFWKKTFWIFGYWYPFGSSSMFPEQTKKRIEHVNDKEVSRVLFNNFITGFGESVTKAKLIELKKNIHQTASHSFKSVINFQTGNKNRGSEYADLARGTHLECAKLVDQLIEEAK
mgnify:CR=1 FL=1